MTNTDLGQSFHKSENIKDTSKEICSDQISRTAVHLGSGSYGSCYLALYRGIRVLVEEFRVKQLQYESREEAEAGVAQEYFWVRGAHFEQARRSSPSSPSSWGMHRAHTLSFDHSIPRKSAGHLLYYIHCTFTGANSRQNVLRREGMLTKKVGEGDKNKKNVWL